MTNSIKNPFEEEAINSLNNHEYLNAAQLFYQIFKTDTADKDRNLTHACVAVWLGIQNSCRTAGSIYICAMSGLNDVTYASELFITCLFRLRQISPEFTTSLSEKICDTVEKTENILNHLVDEDNSTYAMAWFANVLRGMNSFSECRNFIDRSLKQESLPEGVVKQLSNCRENIKYYEQDCLDFSHHVKKAFPDLPAINEEEVKDLNDLITVSWKEVLKIPEERFYLQESAEIFDKADMDKETSTTEGEKSGIFCKMGFHHWSACKCSKCGKIRDRFHDLSKDCETCSVCGKKSGTAHKWEGCKCTVCMKSRDSGHIDNGNSVCSLCGKKIENNKLKPDALKFIKQSVTKPSFCNAPVSELQLITSKLSESFLESGISSSGVSELITYGLIAICPVCHDYISGGALLMMDVFSSAGGMLFSGNTGGMERLIEGKCKSYSCFSASYDLYWCPDLDNEFISDIKSRHGLHIDRSVQEKRNHIWRPGSIK